MRGNSHHFTNATLPRIILFGLLIMACPYVVSQEARIQDDQCQRIHWQIGKERISTSYFGHAIDNVWIISMPADKPETLKRLGRLGDEEAVEAEMHKRDHTLHVWQWKDGTLKKRPEIGTLPSGGDYISLPGDRYFADFLQPDGSYIMGIKELSTGRHVHRLPENKGWSTMGAHGSMNGNFVGIISIQPTRSRSRIGLIDTEKGTLEWVTTVSGCRVCTPAIPSNNGKYIAMHELWKLLGVVDVEKKELLSTFPSDGSESATAVCFSSDSKIVYIGGNHCRVRTMDIKTGRQLSQWYATDTGKEADFYPRINDLSVSPDGQFVAAWTTEGGVFVWSKTTDTVVKLSKSKVAGGLLAFSPDSKKLATTSTRSFEIWDLEQVRKSRVKSTKSRDTN